MTHDLENIGDTDLLFATIELLASSNPPFRLPTEAASASATRDRYSAPIHMRAPVTSDRQPS